MIKINNNIIGYVTIKNKKKPVYSGMEVLSIDQIFEIKAGGDVSKMNYQDHKDECYKYPIYSNYVSNYGLYGYSDTFKINEESITITARGTIGKTFYRNIPFTPIGRLLYLKSKKEDIDMKYFSYLIDNIGVEGEGGVINSLTVPMIKKYELKFFSNIHQQEKIATVLSQQEEQVNNIKTLIEKLEKRNQYYAERLLSGELRVREGDDEKIEFYENKEWKNINLNGKELKIPKKWNKEKINNIIPLKKGTSISSNQLNYEKKGIQYLRTNEIWENSSKSKESVYFDGDMQKIEQKTKKEYIICFDGYNKKPFKGTLGMVTNNGSGICSGELHKILEKENISKYYVNVMMLKNFRFQEILCRYAEGSSVQHAGKSLKKIEEVLIPYKEQILLNNVFEKMLIEIEKLKEMLPKEQKRFDWMSDALLSGEYQIVD